DQVAAVLRHHAAVLLVVLAAPVEVVDLEGEAALALGDGGQHLDTGGYDFGADAVPGNGGDCVGFHGSSKARRDLRNRSGRRQWPILAAVPRRAALPIIIALAALAGTVEVVVARRFLLDDALIHVRSADLLLQAAFPTVDGVTRSFADSSPLFLVLTAAGLALGGSFYVTKILSLAAFGALVAALIAAAWRERHPQAQAIVVALLVLVLSPFGVKWLTDGKIGRASCRE